MLELLRKFEDESAEHAEASEEDEDESDLAQRFASVNLGESLNVGSSRRILDSYGTLKTPSLLTPSGRC